MRKFLKRIEDWAFDDDSFILGFLKVTLVVCVLIGGISLPIILLIGSVEAQKPHILLDRADWTCEHSHVIMTPMLIGKVVMMRPEERCDNYRMNGY